MLLTVLLLLCSGYTVSFILSSTTRSVKCARSHMRLSGWTDISSAILSAGVAADYATEIENAVGEEVYGPIFKAGIFIFASGLFSAGVTAFIVSNRDSWNDLDEELERGKEAQLIGKPQEAQYMNDASDLVEGSPVEVEAEMDDLDL